MTPMEEKIVAEQQEQEVTRRSRNTDKISEALAKAQGEFKAVKKSRTATVHGKSKDGTAIKYSYKYADLADVVEAIREPLCKNGLCFTQTLDRDNLISTLMHSSGQQISNYVPLVSAQGNGPQALGSSLTYSRRYGLTALLGIAAEEDEDAQAAEAEGRVQPQQAPKNQRPASGSDQRGKPAQADYAKAKPGWENELCTQPQRNRLWALAKEAGYDEAHLKDAMQRATGKESTKELTKMEVQVLFKEFEKLIAAVKTP